MLANNSQVSLEQPNVASVHKSDAITDETLVTEALEIFGGEKECTVGTRNGRWGSFSSSNSTTLPAAAPVKTGIYGVSKSTSNHLVSHQVAEQTLLDCLGSSVCDTYACLGASVLVV